MARKSTKLTVLSLTPMIADQVARFTKEFFEAECGVGGKISLTQSKENVDLFDVEVKLNKFRPPFFFNSLREGYLRDWEDYFPEEGAQ